MIKLQKLLLVLNFGFLLSMLPGLGQEINYGPHSLKSHGYLRTGLGRSLSGGEQVQFQMPGALVKSRFGNEANHYSELEFDYMYNPEDRDDSYELNYMMVNYLAYGSKDLSKSIHPETTQLYFKWNHFYKDLNLWVGKRYYQREEVHIVDWFWLNAVQDADVGFGVENISFKGNEILDVAFLRFSDLYEDENENRDETSFEDYKLDVRLKNIQINPRLNFSLLGQLGFRLADDGVVENNKDEDKVGYTIGAWYTYKKGNFYNRTSAIYRDGVNLVQSPYTGRGLVEYNSLGYRDYNLDEANDLQIITDLQYDDYQKNGFLGVVSYQRKDFGIQTDEGNDKIMNHVNVTGRYSRYLSKRFRLSLETSYDYISHKDDVDGNLYKISFSPEITWDKGMFSRPVLRPFITYATWSEALKGQIGVFNDNEVYKDKTSGFTAGLQLELWW